MRPHRKDAGFTLIEMLTVLVIIGLMSAAVVLTLPPSKDSVQTQVEDILFSLNTLSQESVVTGEAKAFALSDDEFQFLNYRSGLWTSQGEGEWPDYTVVSLTREGAAVELGDNPQPLIFFEPTGMSTPFSLSLRGAGRQFVFSSEGDGRVMLETAR